MAQRWKHANGGRLRKASGERVKGDTSGECCCEECNCEENGPTAEFSYTQTDDDPCTFDFFDDSTAGSCGAIVSWLWECGATTISTSQNPTDIDMEDICGGTGPWDVTLTVTDSEGCEDSAVMEVHCVGVCDQCDEGFLGIPVLLVLVIEGASCQCQDANGREFDLFGGFGPCTRTYDGEGIDDLCGTGGYLRASLLVNTTEFTLNCQFFNVGGSQVGQLIFKKPHLSFQVCSGTHSLTLDSSSGCSQTSASATIVIP